MTKFVRAGRSSLVAGRGEILGFGVDIGNEEDIGERNLAERDQLFLSDYISL